MKKSKISISTVRKYFTEENNEVSLRRFKKVLNNLVSMDNPEALVIASGVKFKNMSSEGFEKNRVRLLEKAVFLGFSPAMVELAEIYYENNDYPEAFELYEEAANLNHAYALKVLATNYEYGLYGYKKNIVKAEELRVRAKDGMVWSTLEGYDAECCDYDGNCILESMSNSESD